MKLGILVSQFPELHETFILKELLALREAGIDLRIFSLKRCRDRIIHPEARSLLPATEYAPLASLGVWGEALLEFLRSPLRSVAALGEALADARDPVSLVKAVVFYLKSLAFSRRARRLKVTHLHAHWATFPTTAARILGKVADLPFSFTAHAWDLYVQNPTLKEKVEAAEFVVTCTAYNQSYLKALSPHSERKIVLNYHGVELDRFSKRGKVEKGEVPLLLSVGRLVETKGFLTLLKAFSLLKEQNVPFRSVIVGEGPLRRVLEKEIRVRHLKEVRLVGALSREALLEYYRKAACFVLPCEVASNGDRDGIPNVLLEAMSGALPVITTDISGIPEAVASGKNGILVGEKDPSALAQAIGSILKEESISRRLGEEAHETISKNFNAEIHLKKLTPLFEEKKAPVKVLYVIWSLEIGGAEKLVVSLAEGVNRERFQPIVCCLNHPGALAGELASNGVPVVALHKRPGLDFSVILKLMRLMRQEKIQIVHTHLWGGNVWGRIAAFFAKVPVRLATEHGIQEWRGPLHRSIDKLLSYTCQKILFVADHVREDFCRATGVASRKCHVILNAIDAGRFTPPSDRQASRKEMNLPSKGSIVLSVGRLAPEKRYDLLLKAFTEPELRAAELSLIVVGSGEERKSLLKLKKTLGLNGRVQFLEERQNIEGLYRAADLFVQFSSREALSLAMLEAMASELPVIVSSVGDHAKVIRDGVNGFLVPAGDIKTFAKKLAFLLSHPAEAVRIGKEARKTVLSYYSRERMIHDTETLYEELLNA